MGLVIKAGWTCGLLGALLLWGVGAAGARGQTSPTTSTMPATTAAGTRPALLSVPDEAACAKALALIQSLFKDEYARHSAPDKAALAKVLLQQAQDTHDDAAARYVLLEQANELAIAAGDPEMATGSLDLMGKYYAVSVLERKVRTVLRLPPAELSPGACEALASICMDLVDRQVEADGFEMARQMADLTEAAAAHSKRVSFAASLQPRLAGFRELLAEYAAVQPVREKLRDHPEDADANLILGKFYCLSKGDFRRGLPFLAQGADSNLASLAAKELAASGEPARQIEAADGWWELSKTLSGVAKAHAAAHATGLYQAAVRNFAGITLLRIQSRLGNAKEAPVSFLPNKPGEKTINLLTMVDPEKDAVEGKWKLEHSVLSCAAERHARVELPYQAPEEYDLRVVFTRTKGDGAVVVLLTGAHEAFGLSLDNQGHNARFESVGRKISTDNPTKVPCALQNATRYAVVVEVRKDSLRALLNGKVLTEHKTDYKDLSRYQLWKLKDEKVLGLGAGASDVTFERVEVVEVTGTGKKTR